jgi:glycosyltransferase involved in cell wall biosynthesis
MPPLRVLHITVGLEWGGAEKLLAEIAARTNPERFSVEVLALKGWGPVGDILRERKIPVTCLEGRGLLDGRTLARAARFFRTASADIIHSHLFWPNLLSAVFKGRRRLLWHVHETGEWMSLPWVALERMAVLRTDRIIAVSEAAAQRLARRAPGARKKTTVVPNAIPFSSILSEEGKGPLKARLFGFNGNPPVVGYVGRMDEPVKGLNTLLEAARLVGAEAPSARFVLVGQGRDRAALKKKAGAMGLGPSVLFLDGGGNLESFYRAFDVFALPSVIEGFGLAILEAMAAACPVAATRVGGIPEVVVEGETGLLVPPRDAQALAGAVLTLLRDPARAARMGQKGRERLREKFDMAHVVKSVEDIYENILRPMPTGFISL